MHAYGTIEEENSLVNQNRKHFLTIDKTVYTCNACMHANFHFSVYIIKCIVLKKRWFLSDMFVGSETLQNHN